MCLPWKTKAPLNATGCHCSAGYYGPSCSDTQDPYCSSSAHVNLQMTLTDSYGDGWTFSNFALTDALTGLVVGDALDSLCTGSRSNSNSNSNSNSRPDQTRSLVALPPTQL